MPELVMVSRNGGERAIKGEAGLSIMELIRDSSDGELQALCGGCCSCATCHIFVDSNDFEVLPPMSADENDLLDSSSHRRAGSRLSCQIPFSAALDGLRVTIAPED